MNSDAKIKGNNLFYQYADKIKAYDGKVKDSSFILDKDNNLEIYYAPFDYINKNAKIVIVGITPGLQQAENALQAGKDALKKGANIDEACRIAKETGSFSGAMRSNLIKMLDYFQINKVLNLASCSSLFGKDSNLVHYTSCLRYPVFFNDKNYNGTPKATKNILLKKYLEVYFGEEAKILKDALFVPLGDKVIENMNYLISQGYVSENKVLKGLQHPSGANAERIAYLLGNKKREDLSDRTDPDKIDNDKKKLILQIEEILK